MAASWTFGGYLISKPHDFYENTKYEEEMEQPHKLKIFLKH
jgi:hypothetical protein